MQVFYGADEVYLSETDRYGLCGGRALLDGEFAGVVPLAVQGDGNCLFRAASLLALGNEGHHAQLRSMVVSELEEHAAAFYADGL